MNVHIACRTSFAILLLLTPLDTTPTNAQVALYDNLGVLDEWVGEREWWITPAAPDRRFAQQFLTGDSSTLSQVSVELSRVSVLDGSLSFELWRDDGSDRPQLPDEAESKIATLGVIDVAEIPRERTTFTFDELDVSLERDAKYWVVADFANVENLSRGRLHWYTAFWPVPKDFPFVGPLPEDYQASRATIGTNGAAHGHLYKDGAWQDFADIFGEEAEFFVMSATASEAGRDVELLPGDADQDLKFDQLDLVQVQVAAKYLAGQSATWAEGDWDGAPGGTAGNPPPGDGLFNQFDIIAALQGAAYLTGPYGALQPSGQIGDSQTSIGYDASSGELWVDAPAGAELTSINIDSAANIFAGQPAENLGGSFDNDADNNIFKATFGGSFGSLSFGNVAQAGLSESLVLGDLTVVGSLAGGGDLGNVDLVYVPEPGAIGLLAIGVLIVLPRVRQSHV